MKLSLKAAVSLTVLFVIILSAAQQMSAQVPRENKTREVEFFNGREVAARQVLVKFRQSATPESVTQVEQAADADAVEQVGRGRVRLFRSRSKNVNALLRELAARADVLYVEPNYILRADATPNDPGFSALWGLQNSGQSIGGSAGTAGADIGAATAWELSTGSRANVVAIIDTGVDYTHPDLSANIWSAPAPFTVEIGGQTIRCEAGTHGFNAITKTCDPMDDNNHGTHVAGTIGATGNNGVGVVGVNQVASIMALKFLDAYGSGTLADAINAIEFAIQVKLAFAASSGANVRVLSNSYGYEGTPSQAFLDEINRANANAMLFVAAAGNGGADGIGDNNDLVSSYPANYTAPNVVSVAATDNRDARASFSNYGRSSVHLGAPGVLILSTLVGNRYEYYSGTSMATPHVSGAAALVLSRCSLDTAGLKSVLLNNVDLTPSLSSVTISGGRLNVNKAIRACAPGASATFVKTDTATQGTWKGTYGSEGYHVINDATNYPAYAQVTANGQAAHTWVASTNDTRALQKAASSDRLAAAWYSATSLTIDVSMTAGTSHQVALYFLDWDSNSRALTAEVFDAATNTLLDSRSVSAFNGGRYLVWNLSGRVKIRLTRTGGDNAIVSGLFFDPTASAVPNTPPTVSLTSPANGSSFTAPADIVLRADASDLEGPVSRVDFFAGGMLVGSDTTAPYEATWSSAAAGSYVITAKATDGAGATTTSAPINLTINGGGALTSATFVNSDATTQGSWKGIYGQDGYQLVNEAISYPAYATVTAGGQMSWTWASSTADARALQKATTTDRIAATWYSDTSLTLDVNLTDGQAHQLALYCLDWDSQGRAQTVEIVDAANGSVLDSRSVADFSNGKYLVWNIAGHVKIRMTRTAGPNAVASGLFLAPTR